jgi:hypothetical protein
MSTPAKTPLKTDRVIKNQKLNESYCNPTEIGMSSTKKEKLEYSD